MREFWDKKSNMDFVMNGPRLQTNMIEGFENSLSPNNTYLGLGTTSHYYYYTNSDLRNKYTLYNNIELYDTWDGRQALSVWTKPTTDQSDDVYRCKRRFAVKVDNEPDTYFVISEYRTTSSQWRGMICTYVKANTNKQDYTTAKVLSVTLPLSEWWAVSGDINEIYFNNADTTTGVYTGTPADGLCWPAQLTNSYNNTGGSIMSNPGQGRIVREVDKTAMTVKMTFHFPATACSIKQNYSNQIAWQYSPLDMSKRKYAMGIEQLYVPNNNDPTESTPIVKVYSPQKGCLALKSYLNGEIPILNE